MMELLALPLADLTRILEIRYGKGRFHARALYREIFQKGNPEFHTAPEFVASPRLTAALRPEIRVSPGKIGKVFAEGGLTKFITRLSDGLEIESVIIPMARYSTLCVSCQAGCRMGCAFCETGRMGLIRHLAAHEILGQLYTARHVLKTRIQNVVFMGMGEPLDNFEPVRTAIRIMADTAGFGIAPRHITVSTAGLVPGIRSLAAGDLRGLRLAISITAADNPTRTALMPVNRAWPLESLKAALMEFPLGPRGTLLFAYILIRGVNDSPAHAEALAAFIHPLPVRLNLIPCNPVPGTGFETPSDPEMNRFSDYLTRQGIFVIRRWTRGRSVSAGCGQLGRDVAAL